MIEYFVCSVSDIDYGHSTLRLFTLSGEQWKALVAFGFLFMIALTSITLALQKETSGFILLISQISTVYGLLVDQLILSIEMKPLQIIGALIVLFFNVLVIILKIKSD